MILAAVLVNIADIFTRGAVKFMENVASTVTPKSSMAALNPIQKAVFIQIIAIIIGFATSYVSLLSTLIWVPITMPCHELGHTLAYWLTGAPAIPTYFMTALLDTRSTKLALCITAILAAGIMLTRKCGRLSMSFLLACFLIIQIPLSFVLSVAFQEQICIAAGLAGESLLAPLLLFLSFENLGSWWLRHRYIFTTAALISLGNSLGTWLQILAKTRELPYGSLLLGEDHGDINRLIDIYLWSEQELSWLFFSLALLSLFASASYTLIRLHLSHE